jgi:hypothetical protein
MSYIFVVCLSCDVRTFVIKRVGCDVTSGSARSHQIILPRQRLKRELACVWRRRVAWELSQSHISFKFFRQRHDSTGVSSHLTAMSHFDDFFDILPGSDR